MNNVRIGEEFNAAQYKSLPESLASWSKYKEKETMEGLTLYDIYRKPRKLIEEPDLTIDLNIDDLNAELTCPVCLGILHDTHTAPKCLHRFCLNCIATSIRTGRKECPSCRTHVASRRWLRPDTNFDSLIRTIYPNLEGYEKQVEKEIEATNRSLMNNSFTDGCKRGMKDQQNRRRNASGKRRRSTASSSDSDSDQDGVPNRDELDFTLSRDRFDFSIAVLERERLRCSMSVSVSDLLAYLSKKLGISASKLQIFAILGGRRLILKPEMSLHEIQVEYPATDGEVQLWYRSVSCE